MGVPNLLTTIEPKRKKQTKNSKKLHLDKRLED